MTISTATISGRNQRRAGRGVHVAEHARQIALARHAIDDARRHREFGQNRVERRNDRDRADGRRADLREFAKHHAERRRRRRELVERHRRSPQSRRSRRRAIVVTTSVMAIARGRLDRRRLGLLHHVDEILESDEGKERQQAGEGDPRQRGEVRGRKREQRFRNRDVRTDSSDDDRRAARQLRSSVKRPAIRRPIPECPTPRRARARRPRQSRSTRDRQIDELADIAGRTEADGG